MNAYILIFLLSLAIILFGSGQVFAGTIIALLILLDIFGNIFAILLGFLKSFWEGLSQTGESEFGNVAAAKTKYPSGKRFIEDTLKLAGKEAGKGAKAYKQHKKITPIDLSPTGIAGVADNFMQGIMKMLKK